MPVSNYWETVISCIKNVIFFICNLYLTFISGNKPSLSSMLETIFKSLFLPYLHQATTPTHAVPFSSLPQTTAGAQPTPKPKVTPKQDELNKDMEKEILVSFYRKWNFGQASEVDRKEMLTRQPTLKWLKKELKEVIQNDTWQKKLRNERKRQL